MNKIKRTLMTFAVLVSICSAFAFRAKHDPKFEDGVYYYNGSGYVPVVGIIGIQYLCMGNANVCTYTYNSSTQTYTPFNIGVYTPIILTDK